MSESTEQQMITGKYPYKAKQNAIFSIQLYEGNGPIDLLVTSNLTAFDKHFHMPSLDAERHGREVTKSIIQYADGDTLKWLRVFVGSMEATFKLHKSATLNNQTKKDSHE